MEQENEFSDPLNELERSLGQLQPAPARLDIAHAMFLAGQESAKRRSQVLWPLASACLALLSLTLGVMLVNKEDARVADRIQETTPPVSSGDLVHSDEQPSDTIPGKRIQSPKSQPATTDATPDGDSQWQDPLEDLLRRRFALLGEPDDSLATSQDTEQVTSEIVRYGDWKTMLDMDGWTDSPATFYRLDPFRWLDLFHVRGI